LGSSGKRGTKVKQSPLKLIRIDKERNLRIVKMVTDESMIMKLMVHERIVRFIMFEIESLGIVLEYLPLGSLFDYIKNCHKVMRWSDRHQIMLDICEGMEFLHSNVYPDGSAKKVLFHQDLKSGNVLMCMEGTPPILRGKISDFGLSCKFLFILTL
jgi:serine/threonine protein kinase